MAEILGVYKGHYANWETTEELIPLKRLTKLCNHFNVSMDYVIGITRNKNSNGIHELDKKIIGENLKKLRKDRKVTQEELANLLNTTHSTISAYENGKTMLLTAFAIQISKTYDVSLDWLCGRIK